MNQITITKDLKNHWIFQNEKYFKWWMIILMEANEEDSVYLHRYELLPVKKGQIMKSLKDWAELFKCHERTVKKFFFLLEQNNMICTIKNTNRALQPTLIELSLSGCFCQNSAEQSAVQSAVQKTPMKSVRKEPVPEPFSELDDTFRLEEPKPKKKSKPKVKKEPSGTYQKCIDIYYEFYKGINGGVSPKFSAIMGAKMKSIIKYLESESLSKMPHLSDDKEGLSASVVQSLQFVFSNWHKLDDFWQKQVDLSVIDSKFNTILTQIKNNNNGKSTKPTKSERTAAAREKMFNFNISEEGDSNGF